MVNREAKRDVTVSKDALLKSYSKRLKDDVRSLADNFSAIVKTCRSSGMQIFSFSASICTYLCADFRVLHYQN